MMELAVIDFETTGIDPQQDEIIQVAVLAGDGQVLLNELCRPEHTAAWPGAQRVNGISPQMVADKPSFAHYAPRVRELLAGAKTVVAYNAGFEQSFLRAAGIDPGAFKWADPMELFARQFGAQRRRLSTVAALYGYSFDAHDALEDVRATLYVYRQLQPGTPLLRAVERAGAVSLTDGARTVHCLAPTGEADWLYLHRALGLCPITAAAPRPLVYKGVAAPAPVPCTLEGFEDHSRDGDWVILWVRAGGRLLGVDCDHFKDMQGAGFVGLTETKPDRGKAGRPAGGQAPRQMTLGEVAQAAPAEKAGRGGNPRFAALARQRKALEALVPNADADPQGPLFGKTVVFTGELALPREEAGTLAARQGAVVKTGVTKVTDYLVAGRRDQDPAAPKGMSTKEQKARQLTETGKANITVLSEEEFMEMVGETSHV